MSVHPLRKRKKHRRGKRGGKKRAPLLLAPTAPEKIVSLRQRLSQLAQLPRTA